MSKTETAAIAKQSCTWCGFIHGTRCPYVRAIEYYQNGMVKRVEFVQPQPRLAKAFTQAAMDEPIESLKSFDSVEDLMKDLKDD